MILAGRYVFVFAMTQTRIYSKSILDALTNGTFLMKETFLHISKQNKRRHFYNKYKNFMLDSVLKGYIIKVWQCAKT